ncbi:hypothetical protein RRG08_036366 [Elysia crispata]|uniref:Uncharacterized protein n=1 Tax=Elysia crispata TaxID=231223 RepID=A0AAE0ZJV4_9GAST|nr:hypothetical protein RRG08_036366 [Elysia crispata]
MAISEASDGWLAGGSGKDVQATLATGSVKNCRDDNIMAGFSPFVDALAGKRADRVTPRGLFRSAELFK